MLIHSVFFGFIVFLFSFFPGFSHPVESRYIFDPWICSVTAPLKPEMFTRLFDGIVHLDQFERKKDRDGITMYASELVVAVTICLTPEPKIRDFRLYSLSKTRWDCMGIGTCGGLIYYRSNNDYVEKNGSRERKIFTALLEGNTVSVYDRIGRRWLRDNEEGARRAGILKNEDYGFQKLTMTDFSIFQTDSVYVYHPVEIHPFLLGDSPLFDRYSRGRKIGVYFREQNRIPIFLIVYTQ